MDYGYIRVSTADQNEARQVVALGKKGIARDRMFVDKSSGGNTDRKALHELIDAVECGDTVYVVDFSRLARSTKDLLELVEAFRAKGVGVVSLKESFDTSTASGKLMLTMMAAIYEFELAVNHERQAEGIAIAKASGKYAGRKPSEYGGDVIDAANAALASGGKAAAAKVLGVSRQTVYRMIKDGRLSDVA